MLLKHIAEDRKKTVHIEAALGEIGHLLDDEARYKSFDVDETQRIVYWVTQEMEDEGGLLRNAKTISKELLKTGHGLWSVYMCLRDNFRGYDDSTDWVKFEVSVK